MRSILMLFLLAHALGGCGAVAPRPPNAESAPSQASAGIRTALGPAIPLAADDLAARARSDWRPAAGAGATSTAPATVMVVAPATVTTVSATPASMTKANAVAATAHAAAAAAATATGAAKTQRAAAPASPLAMLKPTPRYAETVARVVARHPALDPDNRWYRPDLATWVAERRDEYRKNGVQPELALLRAIGDLEQE